MTAFAQRGEIVGQIEFSKDAMVIALLLLALFQWDPCDSHSMGTSVPLSRRNGWVFLTALTNSILQKWCVWVQGCQPKNFMYFTALFPWNVRPWNPAAMLWTCPSMERYPWRGNEVLAYILSWASRWQPASSCQWSWKWILQPPAKLLQLMACGTELSHPIMPCSVCRFMSLASGCCCSKPLCFGVCYTGINNRNRWTNKILRWFKIRLVTYFTSLPISCRKPSDTVIFTVSGTDWEG